MVGGNRGIPGGTEQISLVADRRLDGGAAFEGEDGLFKESVWVGWRWHCGAIMHIVSWPIRLYRVSGQSDLGQGRLAHQTGHKCAHAGQIRQSEARDGGPMGFAKESHCEKPTNNPQ